MRASYKVSFERGLLVSFRFITLCGALILIASCSERRNEAATNRVYVDAVSHYAVIAEEAYRDSVSTAEALQAAVNALVDKPSAATLEAAKSAWLAAREPYLQTEVYRFYEGPIDHEKHGVEGLLNAWPMDENFVDYTRDAKANVIHSGLINNPDFPLTEEAIEAKNELGGEKNVATGYHAIEFLLWGQDTRDDGPGDRPFTDYITDGSGTQRNQERRGAYLKVTAGLLVKHLRQVHAQWKVDGDYRKAFTSGPPEAAILKMLTGMIVLAGFETGGERLQAALDSQDREDEHSCFSDNTHRDMIQDIQGIQNVFLGSFSGRTPGVGVKDVIATLDSTMASRIGTQIVDALAKANALIVPFESEIAPGNSAGHARVGGLIASLKTLERSLEEVFVQMDFKVPADAVEFE